MATIPVEVLVVLRNKEDNLVLPAAWVVLKEEWEWVVKVTMAAITAAALVAWEAWEAWEAWVAWVEVISEVLEGWEADPMAVVEALEAGRRSCCFSLTDPRQTLPMMPKLNIRT